jgi:hypothetical protein
MNEFPEFREYNRLGEAYEESMRVLVAYIRKINASRRDLKQATDELENKPGCDVLKFEVFRLQEDISRLSAEYDQEHQIFIDRRSKFNQARKELLGTGSQSKTVSVESPIQSQTPGLYIQRMMAKHFLVMIFFSCSIKLRRIWIV